MHWVIHSYIGVLVMKQNEWQKHCQKGWVSCKATHTTHE